MGLLDQLSQVGTAARPGLQQLLLMGGGVNQSNIAERLDKVNQLRETQRELDRRDTMRQAIEAAPDRKGRMDIYGKYEPKSEMSNLAGLTKLDNNALNQNLIKSKTGYYNRSKIGGGNGSGTSNYKPKTIDVTMSTNLVRNVLREMGMPIFNTELGELNPEMQYIAQTIGTLVAAYPPEMRKQAAASLIRKRYPNKFKRISGGVSGGTDLHPERSGNFNPENATFTDNIKDTLHTMTREGGLSTAPEVPDLTDDFVGPRVPIGVSLKNLIQKLNFDKLR